jgi:signal recognition particle receptor subunit alpha
MLDQFSIFTKGGVLLWSKSFAPVKGDPLNALIRTCLLEDRTGETSFTYNSSLGGSYIVKWTLNNKLGVVYVAIHQKNLKVHYAESLMHKVDRTVSKEYATLIENEEPITDFDERFLSLLDDAEAEKRDTTNSQPAGKALAPAADEHSSEIRQQKEPKRMEQRSVDETSGDGDQSTEMAPSSAFNADVLSKKFAKKGKKAEGTGASASKKKGSLQKGKKARQWNELGIDGDVAEDELDFTDGAPMVEGEVSKATVQETFQKMSLMDVKEIEEDSDESDEEITSTKTSSSLLSSFVRNLGVNVMGTQALTRDDIDAPLQDLKKKLMERNVAEEIANKLIESVAASLVGQKLSSFTRVSSAVKAAVEDALVRILTPKKSIDILRGVKESKSRGKPYVIVFVGVNGVGKSTNLSKVAYWLIQNHYKVMIAACDTFRSGAVEQLKTHCTRLGVSLYERGYEKDPAKVAFEATKAAQREGCDVVLVDTAGRMQDNEPLMRALSNLISFNSPDLVLFVGEALVGNDAVDQLTKFNKRLADLSTSSDAHLIDGIVLTKFDTIDDKVGAALSMVYTSGAPIVFVGVGQTYESLQRLNVKTIVRSLLK